MSERECIFGTDGIRDRAGSGYLRDDRVARIVDATAWVLRDRQALAGDFPGNRSESTVKKILVGRDTRKSGQDLEQVIAAAFVRAGHDVAVLGVVPTPGVAYLCERDPEAALGVMISASHNPAEYNGIKFLSPAGAKVSSEFEGRVSAAFWDGKSTGVGRSGRRHDGAGAVSSYLRHLVESCRHPDRLAGRKVAVDTANGATVKWAQQVFRELGAEVVSTGDRPDGRNINEGCGALHPEGLAERVRREGAFLGFAFDGDGDRMIPVTDSGRVLDGDWVMAIAGRQFHRRGWLPREAVVATVMSNIGLEKSLAEAGLRLIRTPVGDRHVYETMAREGHAVGGEQSGHLIFLDDARTGDGILAALRLVDCLDDEGASLDASSRVMTRYPQILLNYRVSRRVPLETLPDVQSAVARAEEHLDGDGRIVLRYSGTEPLARVMVEGPDDELIRRLAEEIGESILKSIP